MLTYFSDAKSKEKLFAQRHNGRHEGMQINSDFFVPLPLCLCGFVRNSFYIYRFTNKPKEGIEVRGRDLK